MLNRLIRLAFGITNKQIRFNRLDIGEDKERAETIKTLAGAHEKYYSMGVMIPDEIRTDLNLEKYSNIPDIKEDIIDWAITPKPIYLIRQAALQQVSETNTFGQINQTPNDFNDKSKEQLANDSNSQDMEKLIMKISELEEKLDEYKPRN